MVDEVHAKQAAVAFLNERGVDYVYREYTKEPLDPGEIQEVLGKLRTGFELFDLAWPIAIPEM